MEKNKRKIMNWETFQISGGKNNWCMELFCILYNVIIANSSYYSNSTISWEVAIHSNCGRFTISLWMLIVYGWKKILENITCGYGHHLWKYWIYHSWPAATRDKFNIFSRDYHNHSWYFPILFHSHAWFLQSGSNHLPHLQNKWFALNFEFQRNATNIAIGI